MNATGKAILTHPESHGHFVYSYTNESQCVEAVCLFVSTGLREGGAALLAMTEAHCQPVRKQLQENGIDVEQMEACGRFICATAESLFGTFMFDGIIDECRFQMTMGELIVKAKTASASGEVRVFGEMVDLNGFRTRKRPSGLRNCGIK